MLEATSPLERVSGSLLPMNTHIGTPTLRFEDQRLLRGAGQFVDDVHLEGMLHAAMLRSQVPHARIRSVRADKARAMPGVVAVFTAREIADGSNGKVPAIPLRLAPLPDLVPFEQPVIAVDRIRHVGEIVAMVIADSLARAEDALDAIELDVDPLPVVPDRYAASRNTTRLFDAHDSNCAITYTASKGDPPAERPDYVRRERFSVQRHAAMTMEPRGVVARWDGARTKLTFLGAAKVPFASRKVLAGRMDLPEECIDMIELDVGGGFGQRGEFHAEDFLVPFAARRLNRPVKWIEDRREHLLAANHSREMDCEIEIGCTRDGRIVSLTGDIWVDAGAYMRNNGTIPPRNVAQFTSGPYDIAHVHLRSHAMLTNKAPIGTYRGPGRFEADFFRERLIDIAARELGIDPVELRRRNLVRKAQMPYSIATLDKPDKKEEFDSGDYGSALDRCLTEFKWSEKQALQGKLIDGRYHGVALACFVEGGAAGPKENARIDVEQDGSVAVYVGSTNIGQGLETVCLQIAADALDVPMDRIKLFHGSTTYLKEGYGSFHSRSIVMGGSAILLAAKEIKEKVRAAAATRLGCSASEVTIETGLSARYGAQTITLADLARNDQGACALSVETSFANHHHTYAYGTTAAHVSVDPQTGHVALHEYVSVEDVGRIINPLTLNGQVVGAIVQGLGGTFLEHLAYDEHGQFLSGSLADYLLPGATDFANIRAVCLQEAPSPNNPLGAKGGGEGGIVPVGGVIANALAAALASFDVAPNALPLSPPRVWRMIHAR